jgi:hypothetical protein
MLIAQLAGVAGFEPAAYRLTVCLPHPAGPTPKIKWSGMRDSNSRTIAWKASDPPRAIPLKTTRIVKEQQVVWFTGLRVFPLCLFPGAWHLGPRSN